MIALRGGSARSRSSRRVGAVSRVACLAPLALLILVISLSSCESIPAPVPEPEVTVTDAALASGSGTALAVPTKDELKRNALDARVLRDLERGSPASIRAAVEAVNADARGMTDQNRVALALAAEMMRVLYPLEPVTWPVPSPPESAPYIGAIRSAQLGLFAPESGTADFLSLVLPALVVAVKPGLGDYSDGVTRNLEKAAAIGRDSVLVPYLQGLVALRSGRAEAAATLFRKAADLDASAYPAQYEYGRLLLARGDGEGAYKLAVSLASRYPTHLPFAELAADSAFGLGDWDRADPHVSRILKEAPNNARFLLMRARIQVERKEYLKANALLDAYATVNKTDKTYLLLRSRVIREWNRNLSSALVLLQEAQRLYPDDSEVLLVSAEVCFQTGQRINQLSGRDFVNLALQKNPSNRQALILLTRDLVASREWAPALARAEQLASSYPSEETRALLARAALGSGQTARAVSVARSLYAVPSPSDEVVALYLEALVVSGDREGARALLSSRMATATSSLKGVLYYYESRLAEDDDARLSALRSSLLADPRNRDALYAMYEWYYRRSDYRKAQYYLKQVVALDPGNRAYAKLQTELDELLARQ